MSHERRARTHNLKLQARSECPAIEDEGKSSSQQLSFLILAAG
jgi:hypothetical protein